MHKYVPAGGDSTKMSELEGAEVFEKEVLNFFIDESTPLSYADSVMQIITELIN
jgi:hypothetical protein